MTDPDEPMRVIDFPDEWATADPIDHIVGQLPGTRDPKGVYVFGLLLGDGSNLYALIYPGGHRFARTAHAIRWGIEERLGPDPEPMFAEVVAAEWRRIIEVMVDANREADAEFARFGLPKARHWGTRHD